MGAAQTPPAGVGNLRGTDGHYRIHRTSRRCRRRANACARLCEGTWIMAEATPATGLLGPLYTAIERLTLVAPLGLRFWDEVSGRAVGDGLLVTVYPETQPARRVPALSNRSGIYVLHQLPGVREFTNGTG